jgi:hypothetical protein
MIDMVFIKKHQYMPFELSVNLVSLMRRAALGA